MYQNLPAALVMLLTFATPAAAEMELSLYLGVQTVDDSTASGTLPDGTAFSRGIDWRAKPLDNPLYYGGRATWWTQKNWGFGVEGTHAKAIASRPDQNALGVNKLEFSDGHNIFTANVMKRFPDTVLRTPKFTPYLGAGVGLAVPHVDIRVAGAASRTFGLEVTGPALRGIAGLKYDFNDRWALFGEYQITWSDNEVTIDPDVALPGQPAGELNTEILTHAVNIGVSYSF